MLCSFARELRCSHSGSFAAVTVTWKSVLKRVREINRDVRLWEFWPSACWSGVDSFFTFCESWLWALMLAGFLTAEHLPHPWDPQHASHLRQDRHSFLHASVLDFHRQLLFFIVLYLVCVWVRACLCQVCMWWAEDSLPESLLSLHTQCRLQGLNSGCQWSGFNCLYTSSHFTSPHNEFLSLLYILLYQQTNTKKSAKIWEFLQQHYQQPEYHYRTFQKHTQPGNHAEIFTYELFVFLTGDVS